MLIFLMMKEPTLVEEYLQETSLQESCSDDAPSSLESVDPILVGAFDLVPFLSHLFPTTPSDVHILDVSPGDFRGV